MATIDKLQSLYRQLDLQASAGEDVVADLRKKINNLELSYLKEEVLPQVASSLGAKIKNLRCSLDCSIQFDEEGIINYTFCTTGSMLMVKDSIEAKTCIEPTYTHVPQPMHSVVNEPEVKPQSPVAKNVRIVDYSEKAIVVYGDTRQLASTFGSIGGYFNARLKEGPGWVFSKRRRKEVEKVLDPYIKNKSITNTFFDSTDTTSAQNSENLKYNALIIDGFPKIKAKRIEIKSITAEQIHITEGNPTSMFVQFLNGIGPELVEAMHIKYLGGGLVSIIPNPKYINASKKLDRGYWVNCNSSTLTKIEQIKTICNILNISVKIELGDNSVVESHLKSSSTIGRTYFSLNGQTPLNKRQSVLACVRLFMELNPNVPFEVVERNFPPELQGSYGVVAKLAKVKSRIAHGYDDDSRYFLSDNQILKAKDGVEFAVCHEWGNQFFKFQEHVKKRFGWTLEEVK